MFNYIFRSTFNVCCTDGLTPHNSVLYSLQSFGMKRCFLRRLFYCSFKGRVQYFSLQVVMNECFLLSRKKNLAQIRLVVYEKKGKKCTFNSKK